MSRNSPAAGIPEPNTIDHGFVVRLCRRGAAAPRLPVLELNRDFSGTLLCRESLRQGQWTFLRSLSIWQWSQTWRRRGTWSITWPQDGAHDRRVARRPGASSPRTREVRRRHLRDPDGPGAVSGSDTSAMKAVLREIRDNPLLCLLAFVPVVFVARFGPGWRQLQRLDLFCRGARLLLITSTHPGLR
jgi:hypothetical protein